MLNHGTGRGTGHKHALVRLVEAGLRALRHLARALAHRRQVMQLSELDDRALKDIGLLRSDVAGALAEPFHKDPSTVLLVRRVERRARTRVAGVTPPREGAIVEAAEKPAREPELLARQAH